MESITNYLVESQRVLALLDEMPIAQFVHLLFESWKKGKQVLIFGNGGSASTASHMANDLCKATIVTGMPRVKAIALTDNVSVITAWANDANYGVVFKEQLQNLMGEGDLVIGISASGNSPNVINAIDYANSHGGTTVGWTGLSGGKLKHAAKFCLHAPTDDIGMIESVHLVLDHLVTKELHRSILAERQRQAGSDRNQLVASRHV